MATKPKKGRKRKPRPPGRPTEYRPEFVQIAADAYARGATDIEVADLLEVSARTLYTWQHKHPEFLQAAKVAKDAADERIVRALYHRAAGYSFDAVKIMMRRSGSPAIIPYREHVPPDTNAASLWLRNRKADEWKDNRGLTGASGGNFIVECITRLVRPGEPMPAAA